MPRAVPVRDPELFSTMNVTPFIDVMLVLLIVLILGVPIATHKLPVELPVGPSSLTLEEPHLLAIDARGALAWDGRAVTDAQLPALLAGVKNSVNGTLHLRTDAEVRYERFDTVLAVVKRAGVTRLGFVGNERMRI